MKTQKIVSLILAIALVFSVGCVSAFAEEAPKVYEGVIATLDLSGEFEANGIKNDIKHVKGVMVQSGLKTVLSLQSMEKAQLGHCLAKMHLQGRATQWQYGHRVLAQ